MKVKVGKKNERRREGGAFVGWEDKKVVKWENRREQTRGRYWWHQNIHVIHLIVIIMTIKFPWYSFHHVKSMHVMDSPLPSSFSKSTATKSISINQIWQPIQQFYFRFQNNNNNISLSFHPYETKQNPMLLHNSFFMQPNHHITTTPSSFS